MNHFILQKDYILQAVSDVNNGHTFDDYMIALMYTNSNVLVISIDSLITECEINLYIKKTTDGIEIYCPQKFIHNYGYDIARSTNKFWWYQVLTKAITTVLLSL